MTVRRTGTGTVYGDPAEPMEPLSPAKLRAVGLRPETVLGPGEAAAVEHVDASDKMTADSLGLTLGELRFTRRLGVSAERYAAMKGVSSWPSYQEAVAELRRREAAREEDR